MVRFSWAVEHIRTLLLVAVRVSSITSNNRQLYSPLTREVATLAAQLTKKVKKMKTFHHEFHSILEGVMLNTANQMEAQVVELLKSVRAIISNPESYFARHRTSQQLDGLYQSAEQLIVSLYLVVSCKSHTLSDAQSDLLQMAQDVSELAGALITGESREAAPFLESVGKFIRMTRRAGRDDSQVELTQAAEVFLMSLEQQQSGKSKKNASTGSLNQFQAQAKTQLLEGLQNNLVFAVLKNFPRKQSYDYRVHAGLSKHAFQTFQTLTLLENEIAAGRILKQLQESLPGFGSLWTELKKDKASTEKLMGEISAHLPQVDCLQYFNVEASGHYDTKQKTVSNLFENPPELESPTEKETTPDHAPLTRAMTVSDAAKLPGPDVPQVVTSSSTRSKPKRRPKLSESTPQVSRTASRRGVDKRTNPKFISKKASLTDNVVNLSQKSQVENVKQLKMFLNLPDATEDIFAVDIFNKITYRQDHGSRASLTSDQVPVQLNNVFTKVLEFARIRRDILSSRTVEQNISEAENMLGILCDCNTWLSKVRTQDLGDIVTPLEVELVEQNYMRLLKPIEPQPPTTILMGCRNDGWHCVMRQALVNQEEHSVLLAALTTQIMSLFSSLRTNLSNTQAFMHLQATLERFKVVLGDLLQVQLSLVMMKKDATQSSFNSSDSSPPLWEEAQTRNKFDVESPKTLTKGSINALVEALTDPFVVEAEFNAVFFMTYRSYIHPHVLLGKLIDRFHVPDGLGELSERIQFRSVVAIRDFVKNCADELDDVMVKRIKDFCTEEMFEGPCAAFMPSLQKYLEESDRIRQSNPLDSSPINTVTHFTRVDVFQFLSLDPEKFAQMLTLVDHSIYKRIKPWELIQAAWSTEKYRYRSVNVTHLVQRLNRFATWAAAMIVWPKGLKQRIEVVDRFLLIARYLKSYNNFCSLMGIFAALEICAVSRLHHTLNGLKKKHRTELQELKTLFDPRNSYKNYRAATESIPSAMIPYIGVTLTDLVFTEDGNPTYFEDGRVNFGKQRLVAKLITKLLQYQVLSYDFAVSPVELSFTREFPFVEDTPLYTISLLREPRGSTSKEIDP